MTWLEAIARWLVILGWSPVGRTVSVAIGDSDDDHLAGLTVDGTVRAFGLDNDGSLSRLLIELPVPVAYRGHYERAAVQWLVAESCLPFRRAGLLPLSWSIVRLVDAPSFVDSTYDRTIGIACLTVRSGGTASAAVAAQRDDAEPAVEKRQLLPIPRLSIDERVAIHFGNIVVAARSIGIVLDEAPHAGQLADIAMVARKIVLMAEAVIPRLPSPRAASSRDPELADVLERLKESLTFLDGLHGDEYERGLAAAEGFAAPYALAFFYEICRLDEVLA
jgi:hypothetical protein